VVVALARAVRPPQFRPSDLLDLVALGTVADLVPLDRNNRVLVAQGLRRIRAGRCVPGIRALLELAGRNLERLTAADLGFVVAPRLNAAGRLADMSVGIACLLTDDEARARALAAELTRLNEERREIEQRMQVEATELAATVRFAESGGESLGLSCSMKAGIRGSSAWLPAESRTGFIVPSSPSRAQRTDRCAVRRAR